MGPPAVPVRRNTGVVHFYPRLLFARVYGIAISSRVGGIEKGGDRCCVRCSPLIYRRLWLTIEANMIVSDRWGGKLSGHASLQWWRLTRCCATSLQRQGWHVCAYAECWHAVSSGLGDSVHSQTRRQAASGWHKRGRASGPIIGWQPPMNERAEFTVLASSVAIKRWRLAVRTICLHKRQHSRHRRTMRVLRFVGMQHFSISNKIATLAFHIIWPTNVEHPPTIHSYLQVVHPTEPKSREHNEQHSMRIPQQPHPPPSLVSACGSDRLMPPGMFPLSVLFRPTPGFFVTGAHSSGVSMIFSTTCWNASRTPVDVFADASMNSEFIRSAKRSPSAYVTWRENSYAHMREREGGEGRAGQPPHKSVRTRRARTLSTLFPTMIFTTDLETYVSSSEYQRGSASNDSRFATSYTRMMPCAPR